MTSSLKPKPERTYVAKTRRCLKCREPFESEWSGERICRRCKDTKSRRGATAETSEYEISRRR